MNAKSAKKDQYGLMGRNSSMKFIQYNLSKDTVLRNDNVDILFIIFAINCCIQFIFINHKQANLGKINS